MKAGCGGRHLGLVLLLAPVLVWLLGLIVIPQVDLAYQSVQERGSTGERAFSLAQYRGFFEESQYWRSYLRTALMSLLATACTLLIAFPVAWHVAKVARGRVRLWMMVALLVPFWASETVRSLGWMLLLRESGVLPQWLAAAGLAAEAPELLYHDATILTGLVYTSLLFMVVPLIGVFETLDDALLEASYDLGGNRWSTLWHIVVPHAAPGIAAGCIVVFMLAVGNYLTPTLLGGNSAHWFTEVIYDQFIVRSNWEQGAAFGLLLLVLSSAVVWVALALTGQRLGQVLRRT